VVQHLRAQVSSAPTTSWAVSLLYYLGNLTRLHTSRVIVEREEDWLAHKLETRQWEQYLDGYVDGPLPYLDGPLPFPFVPP
jgi:hypothetical protein